MTTKPMKWQKGLIESFLLVIDIHFCKVYIYYEQREYLKRKSKSIRIYVSKKPRIPLKSTNFFVLINFEMWIYCIYDMKYMDLKIGVHSCV